MVLNNMISRRIDAGAIILVISGLVAALQADEFTLLTPKQPPAATKILSFPSGERIGSLYLEPESGPDWDDVRLRLPYTWEDFGIAEGDVHVPQDRNIQLHVRLAISPQENARLLAQIPRKHKVFEACRMRSDPHDLSGLSELDPNDLFWLRVFSMMDQRTGTDPRMFEPIGRLMGLRMLSLCETGVTDKGLEHLRSLR